MPMDRTAPRPGMVFVIMVAVVMGAGIVGGVARVVLRHGWPEFLGLWDAVAFSVTMGAMVVAWYRWGALRSWPESLGIGAAAATLLFVLAWLITPFGWALTGD